MKQNVFSKLKAVFDDLTGKNKFDKVDFAILKTMMMLAAVDGDVSPEEIENFKAMAAKCRGYNGESFETLWDQALRSAGYLLLQARLLERDALADVFVKEAEKDFVDELVLDAEDDRTRAFDALVQMASADGDYSAVECACIAALTKRVKEVREQKIAERYPRGAAFEK